MRFITNQQITAIIVLEESTHVRTDTLVTGNQHVEHFGLYKNVKVLFHSLAIRFCNCQSLDHSYTEPLDKLVLPILDQTARANDNDALARGQLVGSNTRLEECVNETHGLQRLYGRINATNEC